MPSQKINTEKIKILKLCNLVSALSFSYITLKYYK